MKNFYQDELVLPFSAKKLFNIVIDVEKYPEFLPWCYSVRILSKREKEIVAEVKVSFKLVKAHYISHIEYEAPTAVNPGYIRITSTQGSFKYLYTLWEFIPQLSKPNSCSNSCLVKFNIQYEFNSIILQSLINLVYKKAQEKIIKAFKERAYSLEDD